MSEQIIPEDINETFADMAEAILRVSDAGEKLLKAGLTRKAVVLLLQAEIGSAYINKNQINYVLDALPELRKFVE